MSFRDEIEARLRAFRAHEARMDDDLRSRIWDQITRDDPDAAFWLDNLQRNVRIRQSRRRPARPSRILAVAAVLILLAVAQMVVRSGPSEEPFVSVGPSTTVPVPRNIDEFADGVAIAFGTALGETEDTRYAYRSGILTSQPNPDRAVVISVEQRWIADDGSGREVIDVEGSGRVPDEYVRGPGFFDLGSLTLGDAIALPDDPGAVLGSIIRDADGTAGDAEKALVLVDLLTYAGVPGPARAGALRALARLGFEPAPGNPAPNLWRVEGSGPNGLRVQVDFDLRTGEIDSWTRLFPGGGYVRLTNIEIDLRRDTQGS